jgi:hypothetical protein
MPSLVTTNLSLDPISRRQLEDVAKTMSVSMTEAVRRAVRALDGILRIADAEIEEIAEKHGEDFARLYARIGRELGFEALLGKRLAVARSEDGRPGIRLGDHQFYELSDASRVLAKVERGGTAEIFEVRKGRLVPLGVFPAAPAA